MQLMRISACYAALLAFTGAAAVDAGGGRPRSAGDSASRTLVFMERDPAFQMESAAGSVEIAAAQAAGPTPAGGSAAGAELRTEAQPARPVEQLLQRALSPARFVPWADDGTRFRLVSGELTAEIEPDGMTIGPRSGRLVDLVQMKLVGAVPGRKLRGEQQLPERMNYLLGAKPEAWRHRLPCYSRLRSPELYGGVDMVYHSLQGELEHDFELAPGADPEQIRFRFNDGRGERLPVTLLPDGSLALGEGPDVLKQQAPVAYQYVNNERRMVRASFEHRGEGWGFKLGSYDRALPLVIDPVWAYSTRIGVTPEDLADAVVVDSDGAGGVTIFGNTRSSDLPVIDPIDREIEPGPDPDDPDREIFIARLDAAGALNSLTYLGGSDDDSALTAARAPGGGLHVVVGTGSHDFPGAGPWPGGDWVLYLVTLPPDVSSVRSLVQIPKPLDGPDPEDPYPGQRQILPTSDGRALLVQQFNSDPWTHHLHRGYHLVAVDPVEGVIWERTVWPPEGPLMVAARAFGAGDTLWTLFVRPAGREPAPRGTPLDAYLMELDCLSGEVRATHRVTGLDASYEPPNVMAAAPDSSLVVASNQFGLRQDIPRRYRAGAGLQRIHRTAAGYQAGQMQLSQRLWSIDFLHVDSRGRGFTAGLGYGSSIEQVTDGAAPAGYPGHWRSGMIIEQWDPDLLRPVGSIFLPALRGDWSVWGVDREGGLVVSRNGSSGPEIDIPLVHAIPQLPSGAAVGRILMDRERVPQNRVRLSARNLRFGSLAPGSRRSRSFTITNGDTRPVRIWVTPLEYEERRQPFRILEGAGEHLIGPRKRVRVTVEFIQPDAHPDPPLTPQWHDGQWFGMVIVNSDNPSMMQELVILRSGRMAPG